MQFSYDSITSLVTEIFNTPLPKSISPVIFETSALANGTSTLISNNIQQISLINPELTTIISEVNKNYSLSAEDVEIVKVEETFFGSIIDLVYRDGEHSTHISVCFNAITKETLTTNV